MKNAIFTIGFFILILFNLELTAQTGWFWQNPMPQGNDLWSLKFTDANTGWATGKSGTLMKTNNGGINYYRLKSGDYAITRKMVILK